MNMNDSEDRDPLVAQDLSDKDNTGQDQWNQFLQNETVKSAQRTGKQYLGYFLKTLAHPYRTMKLSHNSSILNATITMILVAILSALYCFIWFCKLGLRSPFVVGLLKPLLLTALGLVVAYALIYAVLRIEKITVDAKLLVSRFSDLLVPTITALLCAIVLLLAGAFLCSSLLLAIAYLFVFVGMNVLMLQYPLNAGSGVVDSFYTIVVANAITGYIFYKLMAIIVFSAMGGFAFF